MGLSTHRRLPAVHRCSRPTRPDKARKVGYKAGRAVDCSANSTVPYCFLQETMQSES